MFWWFRCINPSYFELSISSPTWSSTSNGQHHRPDGAGVDAETGITRSKLYGKLRMMTLENHAYKFAFTKEEGSGSQSPQGGTIDVG